MKYTVMDGATTMLTPVTNSSDLWSNSSNASCDTPQFFASFERFAECYAYFSSKDLAIPILELFLAFGAFLANMLVIVLIYMKPVKINVFDQILIAHSIVDGLTGLVDIPLFHIQDMFGYWPMGNILCRIWSSYDNNINTTTNLHMLYMSWVRYRSIKAPKTFTHEFLIRKPYYVVIVIWTIGLLIWIPTVNAFGVYEYNCSVSFTHLYMLTIFNLITWFIPLVGIFCLALYIILYLHLRNVIKKAKRPGFSNVTATNLSASTKTVDSNNRSFHLRRESVFVRVKRVLLDPQLKFTVIIMSYWLQWTPPCIIAIIEPFCNCVQAQASSTIYWLTYTVCLTDPLVVLIFHSNVKLSHKK